MFVEHLLSSKNYTGCARYPGEKYRAHRLVGETKTTQLLPIQCDSSCTWRLLVLWKMSGGTRDSGFLGLRPCPFVGWRLEQGAASHAWTNPPASAHWKHHVVGVRTQAMGDLGNNNTPFHKEQITITQHRPQYNRETHQDIHPCACPACRNYTSLCVWHLSHYSGVFINLFRL